MREPKMIVEYWDAGRAAPYIRGAFVAGESIDSELHRTEPKGHDTWNTDPDDGYGGSRAAEVAETILGRIRGNVNRFRRSLKPPKPTPEGIELPAFDKVMRRVLSGGGSKPNPPVPEARPVTIHLDRMLEPAGEGDIRLTGSATFSLSEHHESDQASVEVSIAYRFVEDDRPGAYCSLDVEPPAGFERKGSSPELFSGVVERDEEVTFEVRSESYSADWTGRLIVKGDVSEDEEDQYE